MSTSRIIRLSRTSIALTAQDILPLAATSLPTSTLADLARIDQVIYWEVVGEYDPATQTATLRVLDFIPDYERLKTFRTAAAASPVQFVQFAPFEEAAYQQWVARYQSPGNRPRPSISTDEGEPGGTDGRYGPIFQPYPPQPQTQTITFRYPFAEAKFEHGTLTGLYAKLPQGQPPVTFRIENPCLRAEFNYLTNFLVRKLGHQKFEVRLAITTHPDGQVETEASSVHIDQIDETIIQSLRTERAQRVQSGTFHPKDEAPMLTLTEVAEQLREPGEPASVLTTQDLQQLLIEGARNRAQIEYLAEQHSLDSPVRFTFGHYVGFIFSVTGHSYRHFCWELLDSNATYVWSFPHEVFILDAATTLESQLVLLNQIRRTEYRKQQSKQLPDLWRFKWIEHALQNRTPEETFQLWQGELAGIIA